ASPPVPPLAMERLHSEMVPSATSVAAAARRGQSKFWRSRRSKSPRCISWAATPASGSAPIAEDGHRDLLEEDRLVDLARDRGGDLATLAAPLDHHHHHDLRILHGRERGEPRVVLATARVALRLALRGARLARDVHARD